METADRMYRQRFESFEYLWEGIPSLFSYFGTAGIAEMLIQSHDGFIELLPALPQAWKDGHFKGLCAEGGAVVDCYWKDGEVTKIKIKSKNGGTYKILMPDGSYKEIKLKKNGKKVIEI